MRFVHTANQALFTLSAILSGVSSVPVSDGALIADDAAVETLSQRGLLVAADGTHPLFGLINQLKIKLRSPWFSDALSALSNQDIDTANPTKRDGAPTFADFQKFFDSEPQKSKMDKMVFWSKTGVEASQAFATENQRNTLEMVIGTKWDYYQGTVEKGGHWADFDEAIDGFWDLASQACAMALEAKSGYI